MSKVDKFEIEDVYELLGDLKGLKEDLEEENKKKRGDFFFISRRECNYLISLLEKVVAEDKEVQNGTKA